MHGKQSKIKIIDANHKIYQGLPKEILVGRYHSWAIRIQNNSEFLTTSVDQKNTVMSFKHKVYLLTGIQYHPESVLTPYGKEILKNWIKD